jgi:hypothetical protein
MKRQSLISLTLVAAIAVALAFWVTGERRAVTETEGSGMLVDGLKASLNDVTRVIIESAEGQVTLDRGETEWTVLERGGYPADVKNLRKQLLAIADAELLEAKTSNPDNYSLIGVQDLDAEDAGSTRVTLEGLPQMVSLIIGNQNFQGSATTYVRRDGETASWLASGDLRMDKTLANWLRKDVINLSSPRVSSVTVKHPDGETVKIIKTARSDPNFLVLDLPADRELLSVSAGNTIAGALGSLRLEDVLPADAADAAGSEVVEGVFESFDGLRITTRAWKKEEDHFIQLSVVFDPALVVTEADDSAIIDAEASDDASDQGEVDPAAVEDEIEQPDVAAEAVEMAAVVQGWVFKIPGYKYDNLSKRMNDLLKPPAAGAE